MTDDAHPQERPHAPPSHVDVDAAYETTPPWDIGRPQPAFVRLAGSDLVVGRTLDAGCGTGEHAILAAALGLTALGVDLAPRAVDLARVKAADRGSTASFRVWDALDLPGLGEWFDTVLDCGLFHLFDDGRRLSYERSLREVVPAGGRYLMLCFSEREPGDWGPRRVTRDEIRASFADGWRVDAIEPDVIDTTMDPTGAQAWLSVITRT